MNIRSRIAVDQAEPWNKPWQADGLEFLKHCPVCGEADRQILHADLVDNAFRVAPGKWSLWRCAHCSCAYLDPRPSRETIHLAYENYYTHQEVPKRNEDETLSRSRMLRRSLANGYTNWRYSTKRHPASVLGVVAAYLMPGQKRLLARKFRHMPKLPKDGGKLLDVGCGNGSFLALAGSCGWDVVGLDPDPKAAANAAKKGFTVHHGGVEYFAGHASLFDVITLSHVIEHVHEPVEVLKSCHALLKPGGQLWLETPNVDSFGHTIFAKSWRGLESPRHLILFNRRSFLNALKRAGFSNATWRKTSSRTREMFEKSHAMEQGFSPYQGKGPTRELKLRAMLAGLLSRFFPSRHEFLTITARKAR